MQSLLLVLAAILAGTRAYIQLTPVDYVRLQDRGGGLSLNASTHNKIAFDDGFNVLYSVAKEPARLTVFTVAFDGMLSQIANIDLNPAINGEPEDVKFCRPNTVPNTPRLAISFNDPTNPAEPGVVRLYAAMNQGNPTLQYLTQFSVGPQPVDMVFAVDCLRLLVANQGRPFRSGATVTDPPGTLSTALLPAIIDESSTIPVDEIIIGSFLSEPDGSDTDQVPIYVAQGLRRTPIRDDMGNIIPISANMEPTSVEVAGNGFTCYVAMPKNNAVARINLDLNMVTDLFPFGSRDWGSFYMDASKADNAAHMEHYRIKTPLMPSQVRWVTSNGSDYLLTLDSGYLDDISEYGFKDYELGSVLLANNKFGASVDGEMRAKLADPTRLGQALISTVDGLDQTGTFINEVTMFGGRGITIHDGITFEVRTALVDNLERTSAQFYKEVHNVAFTSPSNTPQQDRDATSPSYGPNVNVIETGFFNNNKMLFMGSSTSGMIYTYVLMQGATCPQPVFHSVYRRGGISSTWQTLYNNNNVGDLGITDLLYIEDSFDHDKLLLVASATSNSISTYRVSDVPADLRRNA